MIAKLDAQDRNGILEKTANDCRGAFVAVMVFSLFINLLMLTVPLYMLQVFDRVIITRSIETLIFLTIITGVALITWSLLEVIRTQTMVRISSWLDRRLSGVVFEKSLEIKSSGGLPSIQGLRDLSNVRIFLTGAGILAILDAPWTPFFIVMIFLMHPMLGWLSLVGAIFLFVLALGNEYATRHLLTRANNSANVALSQAEAATRNAPVIKAMGMLPNLIQRWDTSNNEMLELQARASSRAGLITATSKLVRQCLQVGMLGLGAWLVVESQITAGMMIAGSILMGRALSPVEQAISSWGAAISARSAYSRLRAGLTETSLVENEVSLPVPTGRLDVEAVTFHRDGMPEPILNEVSFHVNAGEMLGIIGPTAGGKSTLASLLVGVNKPAEGHVRLDGADVADWASTDIGQYIGYLPQDIELFPGSIKDNIARMGSANSEDLLAAAQLAGSHRMILSMPNAYDTEVGEGGAALSGGQRQRIALTRALYNRPRFVVLDEPNSNLDAPGEVALVKTLNMLKNMGTTVVVISHKPNIIKHVDKVLVLKGGKLADFGTLKEVLPKHSPSVTVN